MFTANSFIQLANPFFFSSAKFRVAGLSKVWPSNKVINNIFFIIYGVSEASTKICT